MWTPSSWHQGQPSSPKNAPSLLTPALSTLKLPQCSLSPPDLNLNHPNLKITPCDSPSKLQFRAALCQSSYLESTVKWVKLETSNHKTKRFSHLFIQQNFIGSLLCSRHYSDDNLFNNNYNIQGAYHVPGMVLSALVCVCMRYMCYIWC